MVMGDVNVLMLWLRVILVERNAKLWMLHSVWFCEAQPYQFRDRSSQSGASLVGSHTWFCH